MNFVKKIIDNWDPIDLLCCYAPDDEYHSEIEEIAELLEVTEDVNEVSEGIYKIFVASFGEDTFNKPKSECTKIAQLILSNKK